MAREDILDLLGQLADQLDYERDIATLRASLPATELDDACAAGRALPLEQAVDEALDKQG